VGQEEVGGCTQRMQTVCPCLGMAVERPWLALGRPFLSSLAQMGFENRPAPTRKFSLQGWVSIPGTQAMAGLEVLFFLH